MHALLPLLLVTGLGACDEATTAFGDESGPTAPLTAVGATRLESARVSGPVLPGFYLVGGLADDFGTSTATLLLTFDRLPTPDSTRTLRSVEFRVESETFQGDTTAAPFTAQLRRVNRFTRAKGTSGTDPYLADTSFTVSSLQPGPALAQLTFPARIRATSAAAYDTVRATLPDPQALLAAAVADSLTFALVLPDGSTPRFVNALALPKLIFTFTTSTGATVTTTVNTVVGFSGTHVASQVAPAAGAAVVAQGALRRAAVRFDVPLFTDNTLVVQKATLFFTVNRVRTLPGQKIQMHVLSAVKDAAGRTLDSLQGGTRASTTVASALVAGSTSFNSPGDYQVDVTGLVQAWTRPQRAARRANEGFVIQVIDTDQPVSQFIADNQSLSGFTFSNPRLSIYALTPGQLDSTLGGRP